MTEYSFLLNINILPDLSKVQNLTIDQFTVGIISTFQKEKSGNFKDVI